MRQPHVSCRNERIFPHGKSRSNHAAKPERFLCRDRYTTNDTVIERLIALGYEVENLETYTTFPNSPQEPKAENFNDTEKYEEARTRYEQQWADYMEKEEEITRKSEAGEITVYAKIGQRRLFSAMWRT